MFSERVSDYWHEVFHAGDLIAADGLQIAVDDGLRQNRRLMVLTRANGGVEVALSPALAAQLSTQPEELAVLTEPEFRRQLAAAGIRLHGADYLFYFPSAEADLVRGESVHEGIRRISSADEVAFAAFQGAAGEQDLEDAFVELDHWVVFGAYEDGRLVCAASMYPWEDTHLADLGVLTLPESRGRGHARRVVRAISAHAFAQGYETQYRCQLDNAASVALATSAGLSLFATWDVISPSTS